jgi:hypothetical protein
MDQPVAMSQPAHHVLALFVPGAEKGFRPTLTVNLREREAEWRVSNPLLHIPQSSTEPSDVTSPIECPKPAPGREARPKCATKRVGGRW